MTNANEQTYNAVNEILEQFMKENPGVKISYTTQGSDYEQLMKARMASNDLGGYLRNPWMERGSLQ